MKDSLINIKKDSVEFNFQLIREFFLDKINLMIILITLVVFVIIGVYIYAVSPDEYMTSITFIREGADDGQNNRSNRFLNRLSAFGIESDAGLSASQFPDFVKSTPFKISLLRDTIYFLEYKRKINLQHYFFRLYQPSVLEQLQKESIFKSPIIILKGSKNIFKSRPKYNRQVNRYGNTGNYPELPVNKSDTFIYNIDKPIALSFKMKLAMPQLSNRLEFDFRPEKIIIRATMRDPVASAQLASLAYQKLSDFIVKNKTKKALDEYLFVKNRTEEAENQYKKALNDLAAFMERSFNAISADVETERTRLNNEVRLTFNIYNGLRQQLEQAEINLKKETPIFKVIEPPQYSPLPDEPKLKTVLIQYFLFGIFIVILILVGKFIVENRRNIISYQD